MEDGEEEAESKFFSPPTASAHAHAGCRAQLASLRTSWEVEASVTLPLADSCLYTSPMCPPLFLCCPLSYTMLLLWGMFLSNVLACLLLPQALFSGEPRNSLPGLAT